MSAKRLAVLLLTFAISPGAFGEEESLLPSKRYRWRVPTAARPAVEASLLRYWKSHDYPLVPWRAVAAGNYVLMPTPKSNIAIDVATGKRIWEFPWESLETPLPRSRQTPAARRRRMQEDLSRIWEAPANWRHVSDGKSFYYLESKHWDLTRGKVSFLSRRHPKYQRRLFALDLSREGAMRWQVGADSDAPGRRKNLEAKLGRASFLSGVEVQDESLFAIVLLSDGVRKLVELSAPSGELISSSTIDTPVVFPIAGAPQSRVGQVFVRGDVVLAHLMPGNAIIAFNWGRNGVKLWSCNPVRNLRWADPTPVVSDSTVVRAGGDREVEYLDLHTGVLQHRCKLIETPLFMEFAGPTVLTVGASRVEGWKPNGDRAWVLKLPARPSGRGIHSDRRYCLPLLDQSVAEIHLESGKIVGRVTLPSVPCNLTLHRDMVFAQGIDFLTAYPIVDRHRTQSK